MRTKGTEERKMKLELKRFKNYPRMSQETEAFNADVVYQGVVVADAENDGHGGCTFVRLNDKGRAFPEIVAAENIPEFSNGEFNEGSLVQMVDNLVDELLKGKWVEKQRKRVVKQLAANILFNKNGDKDGVFRSYKVGGRDLVAFAKQIAGHPDVYRVLNLMPFEEAFSLLVR